jgi:protein gp37
MADKRIPWLLQVPATKHFISYEPALGPVDAEFYLKPLAHIPGNEFGWSKGIDWVICGGESGPNARPMHPDWAQSLRDQCKAAGVPFFFKQWGAWAPVEVEDRRLGEDRSVGHVVDVLPSGEVLDGRDSSIHADAMERVGKARAGHLLDGVEHHEFPNI